GIPPLPEVKMRFDDKHPAILAAPNAAVCAAWNSLHPVSLAVGSAYTTAALEKGLRLSDEEHDRLVEENALMCVTGLSQCFRLYPCVTCKRITGWRVGLGTDIPPVPCCSEECEVSVRGGDAPEAEGASGRDEPDGL